MNCCPRCGGNIKTTYSVHSDDGDIYRQKTCDACGHVFYTVEYEVIENDAFKKEWSKCRVKRQKFYNDRRPQRQKKLK